MTKEDQFILSLSKLDVPAKDHIISDFLLHSLNWELIKEKAQFHYVIPLMYYHLVRLELIEKVGKVPNPFIPCNIAEYFKQEYHKNLVKNLLSFQELKTVLEKLVNKGIPVIVLKGALWSELLYKNPALRKMSDIDILVKPVDFRRTADQLSELGFLTRNPTDKLIPKSSTHQRCFVKRSTNPVIIDAHRQLSRSYRSLNEAIYWKRAVPMNFDGMKCLRLSNEDAILHSCLHLAFHKYDVPLIWWVDLSELLKKYKSEIDWEYIVKKAIEQRIKSSIFYSLYFLNRLIGNDIPQIVLEALVPNSIKKKVVFFFLRGKGLSIKSEFYERLIVLDKRVQMILAFLLLDLRQTVSFIIRRKIKSLEQLLSHIPGIS